MTPIEIVAFAGASSGLPLNVAEDLAWLIADRPGDSWLSDSDAAKTGQRLVQAVQKWRWNEDLVRVYPDRYHSLSAKELLS